MRAIGIDLGTTNSVIAIGGREPRVLATTAGENSIPSVVGLVKRPGKEPEIVVGRTAVNYAGKAPQDTIYSIKRLMGAVYGEDDDKIALVRERMNYLIAEPPDPEVDDQSINVLLDGARYSPVDISAHILRELKRTAELALGEEVTHAVITIPAYFQDRQRAATREAGLRAGLEVFQIIDEPTAAALAFGTGREEERHRTLVYDLGGGTFDISIIAFTKGRYEVLEISGDNWLGGDDFDNQIVHHMANYIRREYDHDPSEDRAFLAKAKAEAQKAKIALGGQENYEINVPVMFRLPNDTLAEIFELWITRTEFEEAIRPSILKTSTLVQEALERQHLRPEDITEVLMVGGSTAIPLVQATLAELFGAEKIKRHVNPMECVALGASILAEGLLAQAIERGAGDSTALPAGTGPTSIRHVTPFHLGVAAVSGANRDKFVPIIPKNTAYPLTQPKKEIFHPSEDNQRLIRVQVYEGLNEIASLNALQGTIDFELPEGIRADTQIEISFNYDVSRVITVNIRILGTNHSFQKEVRRGDNSKAVQRTTKDTSLIDWREDVAGSVKAADRFEESYGKYMERADLEELKTAKAEANAALANRDQRRGKDAAAVLNNKIFGSGTASLLFIAEGMMRSAPPDVTRIMAQAVASLREAYERGDETVVRKYSDELRLAVARLAADKFSAMPESTPDGGLKH